MKRSAGLSAIDAAFVGLERPGLPMHVGGVAVFDGGARPLTMHELERHVAARLRRLPTFHDVLREPSGGRRPSWAPSGRLSLSAHLFHHELPPPGRGAQLRLLCAGVHEELLDRSRPLWEVHLVDGLARRRQALIIKTHHAITDGIAGVEVAEALFDPAPDAARLGLRDLGYAGHGRQPSRLGLVQALLGAAFTAAGGPIAVDGPFNGPVGPRRSLGTVALPMGAIQRLKRRTGGSVDDVVLALVGMGLSRYLRDVAFEPTPRALRAMVPVSTRAHLRGVRLGNHVSSVFIDLPMEGDDFAARVRTVAASKATLRGAHAAAGSALMVEAAGLLPGPLHGAVVRFAMDLPFANLVVSDVPGPDAPMYMLGRRIEAVYPMLPLARDIGLTIATLSVGGVMGVGVTADPDLVPDAQRIAKAIKDALSRSFAQHLEPVEDHIEPELERV